MSKVYANSGKKKVKNYRDHYFQKAKKENYPARSVYKLQEMDKSFRFFRTGQKVLDLGACPGSWSLFAAQKVGRQGLVVSADLTVPETVFPPQVQFFQEDVFKRSENFSALLENHAPFDIVMSDMAPKTTGIRLTDQTRSLELVEEAFAVATIYLATGGIFITKIFEGPDTREVADKIRLFFKRFKWFKPKSSRAESKEIFWVGLDFKGGK